MSNLFSASHATSYSTTIVVTGVYATLAGTLGYLARGASGAHYHVLVLLAADADRDHDAIAETLRGLAPDVMLEYGPGGELHTLSESGIERTTSGHPASLVTHETTVIRGYLYGVLTDRFDPDEVERGYVEQGGCGG